MTPTLTAPRLAALLLASLLTTAGVADAAGHPLAGLWRQTMLDGRREVAGGLFIVTADEVGLSMRPLSQSGSVEVNNSRGLTDVAFSGTLWTFKSDWGQGQTGEFRLMRKSADEFRGASYLNGRQMDLNVWRRVGKPVTGLRGAKDLLAFRGPEQTILAQPIALPVGTVVIAAPAASSRYAMTLPCTTVEPAEQNRTADAFLVWTVETPRVDLVKAFGGQVTLDVNRLSLDPPTRLQIADRIRGIR